MKVQCADGRDQPSTELEIGTVIVKSCWQTVFQVWTKLRLILYLEALMMNFETFGSVFEYRTF